MYLILLYSVPAALVNWLIQNSIWGDQKKNFHILSALIWTVLASVCFSIYFFAQKFYWQLFLIGFPAQIVLFLGFHIKIKDFKKLLKLFKSE